MRFKIQPHKTCHMSDDNSSLGDGNRPNILVILADDLGWSDIGCYGGEIDTPNLNKLGENGVRFTQAHNTSKCAPSRACLLTGLYHHQVGGGQEPFQNAVTLGEVLGSSGYQTYASGKHHNKENLIHRGFDHYFGLRDGCCNYFNPGRPRAGEPLPAQKKPAARYWCIEDKTLQPYTPEKRDFYTTDYFGKYALKFLDQHQEDHQGNPFFLYLPFTAPHDPLQAWPRDIEKYRDEYTVGYGEIRARRYERQRDMGLIDESWPLSDPGYKLWNSLEPDEKEDEALKMAVYAAMIDRMDQNIGKVLDKIREMGEEDNTLVIFASDNGCSAEVVHLENDYGPIGSISRWTSLGPDWANVSNTPYRFYKNYSFQGGICTPLIANWPNGISDSGRFNHQPCHFIDIMPTLTEVARASYPKKRGDEKVLPPEGVSLVPILKGERIPERGPLNFQWRRGRAVRKGRWKIVVEGQSGWELYDMEKDRTETNNLADKHPKIVGELNSEYHSWWTRCN